MKIASTGTSALPTTTLSSAANNQAVNTELARLLSSEPVSATVKDVQGGQALLDLGGPLLTVNVKEGLLKPGQQITIRFNDDGKGTADLGNGETTTVTVAGNEVAKPPTAKPQPRTYPNVAAAYTPAYSAKTVPTFSNPIVRAEIVAKNPDGTYQVRIDGREYPAEFRETVAPGSKIVARVEATPKGVTLTPLPDTTLVPRQVATAILRSTPQTPIAASLQQLVSTLAGFVQSGGEPTPLPQTPANQQPALPGRNPETPATLPNPPPQTPAGSYQPILPARVAIPNPPAGTPQTQVPNPVVQGLQSNPLATDVLPLTRVPTGAQKPELPLPVPQTGQSPTSPLSRMTQQSPTQSTTQPVASFATDLETLEAGIAESTRANSRPESRVASPATKEQPPLPQSVEQLPKILSTMLPRDGSAPTARQIESFVRDGGLHYEAKLSRAVEGNLRPDAIREIPTTDLKGTLLQAIQEVPATSVEGTTIRGTLETIESQQALNVLSNQTGDGLRLQFPIPDVPHWRTVDLTITPDFRFTDGEANGESSGGSRGYGLMLHTELTEFGETWIDAQILDKNFRAYLYIEKDSARLEATQELDSLKTELQSLGFTNVLLGVRAPSEMPRAERETINAQKAGVPRNVSLIDVRA